MHRVLDIQHWQNIAIKYIQAKRHDKSYQLILESQFEFPKYFCMYAPVYHFANTYSGVVFNKIDATWFIWLLWSTWCMTAIDKSLDAIVFSLKLKFKTLFKIFFKDFFWDFFEIFFEIFLRDFFSSNLGSLWFDLVVYQVSNFYYVWNWSKSLVWWVVLKATLVFIFGPRLGLWLRPGPRLNKNKYKIIGYFNGY